MADDVHWFDPSTSEVLGALLDAAGGHLLVVMTGRPGEWLPASWPHKVFDLAPLTDEQTDVLITALDPGLSADERAAVTPGPMPPNGWHATAGRSTPCPAPRRWRA